MATEKDNLLPMQDMAARMEAVERLTNLFKMERYVHLAVTSLSLALLLLCTGILLYNGKAGIAELSGLFGSSGLITYSTGRLLFMWTQAMRILGVEPEKEVK